MSRLPDPHRYRAIPGLRQRLWAVAVPVVVTLAACGASPSPASSSSAPTTRVITDTLGRQVRVPAVVNRVAAIGTIPVMISYVFSVGAQHTIVTRGGQGGSDSIAANGSEEQEPIAIYHAFAPQILTSTSVENAIMAPVNAEELLKVNPQVVLAPNLSIAKPAINDGVPVVVLQSGATGSDVKQDVTIMGNLFGKQSLTAQYVTYFDNVVKQVQAGVASIPPSQRVSALFLAFSPLRVPVYSTNYMFPIDGATSGTAKLTATNVQINAEQLFAWNPDVIVVQQAADQAALYTDTEYANLKAAKTHRVYLIPQGLQTWTDNSPEMPLGLPYLAKQFYPNRFQSVNMTSAVRDFYKQFYQIDLTNTQISEVLSAAI